MQDLVPERTTSPSGESHPVRWWLALVGIALALLVALSAIGSDVGPSPDIGPPVHVQLERAPGDDRIDDGLLGARIMAEYLDN